MDIFYKEGLEKADVLRYYAARDDIGPYTTEVHGLKGALMNIGARSAADMAKSLELAGKQGSMKYIAQHNNRLLTELDKLLQGINSVLSRDEEGKKELDPDDLSFLATAFTELRTAIENLDAVRMDRLIMELEGGTWDAKHNKIIKDLSKLILQGELEEALLRLSRLDAAQPGL